jgi:hypothetical protein
MPVLTYADLATEALAKWPQLDPARVERAVQIASNQTMIYEDRKEKFSWSVRNSKGNGWYTVHTKRRTCTCRDSQQGNICKHRLAVWLHIEIRTREAAQARRVPQSVIMQQLGYA